MANENRSNKPEAVRNRLKNNRQTYYSYPSVPLPHGIQFLFKEYDYSQFVVKQRGLNQQRPVETAVSSVELPFPKTLVDANSLRVAAFERDFLSERIAAGIAGSSGTGAGDFAMNIANSAAGIIQSMGAAMVKPGEAFERVRSALSSVTAGTAVDVARLTQFIVGNFIPEYIQRPLNAITGKAINPNETLAFEGVNLRNFTFNWDLFPSSKQDSEQIAQIIRFIKNKSLPSLSSGGLESFGNVLNVDVSRVFLRYPNVVIINLLGVQEPYWMRFKPAMVTDITIDYGAGGPIAVIEGGKPAGINLSISFSELAIHTAEDYDYNAYMGTQGSSAGGSIDG